MMPLAVGTGVVVIVVAAAVVAVVLIVALSMRGRQARAAEELLLSEARRDLDRASERAAQAGRDHHVAQSQVEQATDEAER
jgi:signal transduction histidine kinase